ncbi:MAG TPA: nidogen-like domain-containing protein [Myxococcota bacterium]|nr:nidogen-like domain-containing protein [Myxococcota bacterium]
MDTCVKKWARATLLAACALTVSSAAYAKKVFIDFGDQFATSGNNWGTGSSESLEASLVGNASLSVALGFSINTDAGVFDSLFINENGAITFGSALSTTFTSVSALSDLGTPVIAPYYADLQSTAANGDVFFVEDGEILYSYGFADPRPDGSGNYSAADAVQAFHVTWAGPTVAGDASSFTVYADLVIYNLGGGSFALQFGHGFFDPDPGIPDLGGITGFALGSDVENLTGARSGSEDLYYEFLVPEPATSALLGAGLAGVLALRRRRSRR